MSMEVTGRFGIGTELMGIGTRTMEMVGDGVRLLSLSRLQWISRLYTVSTKKRPPKHV